MNEYEYRNQRNVIYGSPCRIVAASQDRNLVQFASNDSNNSNEPKAKRFQIPAKEIEKLDNVLDFGRPEPDWRDKRASKVEEESDSA